MTSLPRTTDTARRVAFKSLGCRVNAAEIECLRGRFLDAGWRRVSFEEEADVYVINTCTVTGLADAESRKVVRRAVRRKPAGGVVAVTGCYAQRDPEMLRGLDGVDLVLGNVAKNELFDHVVRLGEDRRLAGDLWAGGALPPRRFLAHGARRDGGARTRATLKVQDGCNERCTYCVIPYVRGPGVSRDLDEILAEARHLGRLGYREIALTGVHTGSWGGDLGRTEGMADLVRALDGLGLPVRFRLNSVEPATLTGALLDAVEASPAFCRHFHVPLQSGAARTLRRMGRSYDPDFYRERVEGIAARFPGAGIGADVMVGFPGETDADFDESRAFVASLPLSYLHVFTYSARDGTPAARLPGRIDPRTAQRRSRALHAVEDDLRRAFVRSLDGTEQVVLVEGGRGPAGRPTGLTSSYLRVELDSSRPAENEVWRARIGPGPTPRLARATAVAPLPEASLVPGGAATRTSVRRTGRPHFDPS